MLLSPLHPRAVVSFLITATILVLPSALVGFARVDLADRAAFDLAIAEVQVRVPAEGPRVTQESVDLAMLFYGIRLPPGAEAPLLDRELKDRGLTTRGAFFQKARVTIGPAAFSSWSLLGSTLAHELEVHCRQNFLAIWIMDLVGLSGTDEAERQAYAHELRNARRFGLDIADAELIAETMDYYYPDVAAGAKTERSLRQWLARNLLRGRRF